MHHKVATDSTSVTIDLVGADYEAIAYRGSQHVNNTNYRIFCLQMAVAVDTEKEDSEDDNQ